jgi:hypothetical protein
MELKLAARYRGGEQPGVPGRDRGVGIAVVDRCRTVMDPSSKPQGRRSTRRSWATPRLPQRNASV